MSNKNSTPETEQIDTGGGLYIGGNVDTQSGDFIGHDKIVQGDEVARDKITARTVIIYNYPSLPSTSDSTARQDSQDILTCPYRGLFVFRPEHTKYFFGRKKFIQELELALSSHNLVAVLGASGSGKSSVVFAGLVPALLKRNDEMWLFTYFRPSNDPFISLANSLVPLLDPDLSKTKQVSEARDLAERLRTKSSPLSDYLDYIHRKYSDHQILVIADQFEELYSLCRDEGIRQQFLDQLLEPFCKQATNSKGSHLVLTLRADFLGQALLYRPVADALQGTDLKLGPMTRAELAQVVEEPAKLQGVKFEDRLIERILDDVGNEEGSLPLLEFSLTELWQHQRHHILTHTAYDEIGQAKGALNRHANKIYQQLDPTEQKQAQKIFTRLINPGIGTDDTRRLAYRSDLESHWPLVVRLSDDRLLVTNQMEDKRETVEMVHEALIRNWSQLKRWIDEDRGFLIWQSNLRPFVENFTKTPNDEDTLLRGSLLVHAEQWYDLRSEDLSILEKEYIERSKLVAQRKIEVAKRAQQEELANERRLSRRKTFIIRTMSVILTAFVIFSSAWGFKMWIMSSSPWQLAPNFPRDGVTSIKFVPSHDGISTSVYCIGTRNLGVGCSINGKSWNIYQQGLATGRNTPGGIEGVLLGNTRSVSAVAIDYATPSTLYAFVYDGFIYKSNDRGISWTPWSNEIPNGYIVRKMDVYGDSLIAIAESLNTQADSYVFATWDGGKSWEGKSQVRSVPFGQVYDTYIKHNGGTVAAYVASETGLYERSVFPSSNWSSTVDLPFLRSVSGKIDDNGIYIISTNKNRNDYELIYLNLQDKSHRSIATVPEEPVALALEPSKDSPIEAYVLMVNNDVVAITKDGEVRSLNALPWWLFIGPAYDLAAVPENNTGETLLLMGHDIGMLEYRVDNTSRK